MNALLDLSLFTSEAVKWRLKGSRRPPFFCRTRGLRRSLDFQLDVPPFSSQRPEVALVVVAVFVVAFAVIVVASFLFDSGPVVFS